MSDIIDRIKGLRYVHVPQASQLFEEAIAEIERLRLTDAEREAVESTIVDLDGGANFNEQRFWPMLAERLRERSATLRGLLARTGDCPAPDNAADRNNGTTDSE